MSLEPGRTPAHYAIIEPIGEGGRSEVFRARDTKLAHDVAIDELGAQDPISVGLDGQAAIEN